MQTPISAGLPRLRLVATEKSFRQEPMNSGYDTFRGSELALPDCHMTPAGSAQLPLGCYISRSICLYLVVPEWLVAAGELGLFAVFVAMPEAAVNENDLLSRRKNNIWRAWKRPYMQPVAISARV